MAAEAPDDRADVRVFPPAVPLIVVLTGVLFESLWPIDLGLALAPALHYVLGGLVIAAGLAFGLTAIVMMRRSGQSENPWRPSTHVLERGPFGASRNPMYVQMVVVCVGFALLLANWWILVLTPLGAWALQRWAIVPEERYLEAKFGAAYLDYKARVRRWL